MAPVRPQAAQNSLGTPLSELDLVDNLRRSPDKSRRPSDVVLVRRRMFYARPALTARGRIQTGFQQIRTIAPLFPFIWNHADVEQMS